MSKTSKSKKSRSKKVTEGEFPLDLQARVLNVRDNLVLIKAAIHGGDEVDDADLVSAINCAAEDAIAVLDSVLSGAPRKILEWVADDAAKAGAR